MINSSGCAPWIDPGNNETASQTGRLVREHTKFVGFILDFSRAPKMKFNDDGRGNLCQVAWPSLFSVLRIMRETIELCRRRRRVQIKGPSRVSRYDDKDDDDADQWPVIIGRRFRLVLKTGACYSSGGGAIIRLPIKRRAVRSAGSTR